MFWGLLGKPILLLHKCFQGEIFEGIFNVISTIFHMFHMPEILFIYCVEESFMPACLLTRYSSPRILIAS